VTTSILDFDQKALARMIKLRLRSRFGIDLKIPELVGEYDDE
jgi:hypothetical protein